MATSRPEYLQCQFDVAIFRASNLAGVGMIVHDNRGDPIGVLTMHVPISQFLAELEALAC